MILHFQHAELYNKGSFPGFEKDAKAPREDCVQIVQIHCHAHFREDEEYHPIQYSLVHHNVQ